MPILLRGWSPNQTPFTKIVSHGCLKMAMMITVYNNPPSEDVMKSCLKGQALSVLLRPWTSKRPWKVCSHTGKPNGLRKGLNLWPQLHQHYLHQTSSPRENMFNSQVTQPWGQQETWTLYPITSASFSFPGLKTACKSSSQLCSWNCFARESAREWPMLMAVWTMGTSQ